MSDPVWRPQPDTKVEWLSEDLPPPKPRQTKWADVAEQLRARPGKWALVQKYAASTGTAAMIRGGKYSGTAPAGSFDARAVRDPETNTYNIIACFVGDTEAPEQQEIRADEQPGLDASG